MKSAILALTSMLLLSACATAGSTPKGAPADIVEYSAKVQAKAADEMEGGTCPAMSEMVIDYGVMRDQTWAAVKGIK